jgi:hypothetical protein
MRKIIRKTISVAFSMLFFSAVSCGIEDYLYLVPVSEVSIRRPNTMAIVTLPNFSTIEYKNFTNFSLFYRIYVSDRNEFFPDPYEYSILSNINSALASDFSALSSYTSSNTGTVITDLRSQFSNRKYYAIELQGTTVENVLSSSVLGSEISLDFSIERAPVLIVQPGTASERIYTLRRTSGEGNFFPRPGDRLFFNTSDLNSSEYAVATINNDVADKTSATGQRYTYVSIYIVTTGRDSNYTPIYSRPTHVGIFSLPGPVTGSQ